MAQIVGIVSITIIGFLAFNARRMPDLKIWHRATLDSEFVAEDHHPGFTYQEYRQMESQLFEQLEKEVYQKVKNPHKHPLNRYTKESICNPGRYPQNWNRSFELIPVKIRGGALLLHGLTDSPYSLRRIGEIFQSQGVYVLGLRLPGHGTIPAALQSVSWQDWMAATKIGAKHVREKIGVHKPFFLAGYSNGGALAVKYALDALDNEALVVPTRLILFSPAIGVTPFAFVANWHKLISFIPYFEKFKWMSIEPEYDPFKYNSFPKEAGYLSHLLTRAMQTQVEKVKREGRLAELPAILTFQSLADSTVLTRAVIDKLYHRLESNGSELVVLDINRLSRLEPFLVTDYKNLLPALEKSIELPYRLTIITNASADSPKVIEKTKGPRTKRFSSTNLRLKWPADVYSLSHVAVPFCPDDWVYGEKDSGRKGYDLRLGSIAPRGERNLLRIPKGKLMRLRYNPFFDYVEKRLRKTISAELKPG
jgi:alpha-beta hydrolase superfamily lysophospholipase